MKKAFVSSWWEVSLPHDWTSEDGEDCVTFFSQDGVGSFQISAYRKDEELGQLADKDLKEFLVEEIEAGALFKTVQCGSFTGLFFHCSEDDTYWRKWLLRFEQTMIYATYNCQLDERGQEDKEVDKILTTLKVRQ